MWASFPGVRISVLCLASTFILFFLLSSVIPQIFSQLSSDHTQCWVSWTHKASSQAELDISYTCKTKGLCSAACSQMSPAIEGSAKTCIHFTFPSRTDEGTQKEDSFPWKGSVLRVHKWILWKWQISYLSNISSLWLMLQRNSFAWWDAVSVFALNWPSLDTFPEMLLILPYKCLYYFK